MNPDSNLKVTSHVGRDLLASAASFKAEHTVVWEYVVNSLQYVDDGGIPKVQVVVRPRQKEIEIRDNGRGMTAEGLTQYFTMHGENIDRLRGRPGRGKFGTGKSAAFGIGRCLVIDTRRAGTRNVVRLTRDAIDKSNGRDIPLDWMVRNEATDLANGTTVTMSDIVVPKIQVANIVEYIERHLQVFRARLPEVAVNDHICQYSEPPAGETFTFRPSTDQESVLGPIELVIKVSQAPLPEPDMGVAVTAGLGNLVAVETGGVERKELGNYLFGDVDVPALESAKSTIEPYDATRSLQLNPSHPVCAVLIPFVASKLEEVRLNQVRKLNEARKGEQARRLSAEAQRIAEILNEDFRAVMSRLTDIRAASATPGTAGARFGATGSAAQEEDGWIEGIQSPGEVEESSALRENSPAHNERARSAPDIPKVGTPNSEGASTVDPAGGSGKRSKPRGGFRVEYRALGDPRDRSKYDRTSLTILINLDHAAVKNAMRNGSVEDADFKRLSYEIAFTEYAIALGYEMADRDPDIPGDELLFEVRTTLNRVAASAASLYS